MHLETHFNSKRVNGDLKWRSVFQLTCLLCLIDPDVRWKESSRRGGYLGWHEQLLTEKRDLLVTIATLVLPTLMCCRVYSLFCAILILQIAWPRPLCWLYSVQDIQFSFLLNECWNMHLFYLNDDLQYKKITINNNICRCWKTVSCFQLNVQIIYS